MRPSRRRFDYRATRTSQSSASIPVRCPLLKCMQCFAACPFCFTGRNLSRGSACPANNSFVFKKTITGAYKSSMLPCSRSFDVHTCCYECCQLQRIRRQLLVEIRQAVAITHVGTASEFLADGWSTQCVSRAVRAARTKQEPNGKERASHTLCSHIQGEMATFEIYPATVHELEEEKNPTEKIEPRDVQDEET